MSALSGHTYAAKPQQSENKLFDIEQAKSRGEQVFDLGIVEWQGYKNRRQSLFIPEGRNWIYMDMRSIATRDMSLELAIESSVQISSATVYIKDGTGSWQEMPVQVYKNNVQSAQLVLLRDQSLEIFLNVNAITDARLPINIMPSSQFFDWINQDLYYHGVALGGMVFLSFSVFLLFFASRQKSVILLFGYIATRTLLLSVLIGGSLTYYFPEATGLRGSDFPIFGALSAAFLTWFTMEFFSMRKQHYSLYVWMRWFAITLLFYIPCSLFLTINENYAISYGVHAATAMVLFVTGIHLVKRDVRLSRMFTLIIALQFLLGFVNLVFTYWGGMGTFKNDAFMYSAAFWLNGFLIIFLVSRQYYYQVKDRQEAQQQSLESIRQMKKAQEELMDLQQVTQAKLEARVEERTTDLNNALEALETLNRELEAKSTIDELSGLYNRRSYDEHIASEFRRAQRNASPLSVIIIDIDHFKNINDTYGHLVGDFCITWMADRLLKYLRRSADKGFRYGGEEFCMILPETDEEGAYAIANELRAGVEQAFLEVHGHRLKITVSCGVTTYHQHPNVRVEDIFATADKALYVAKQSGRNQVQAKSLYNIERT